MSVHRPEADRRRYEVDPQIRVGWEVMQASLRKRRISLGLTQTDVSTAMGRSRDFVAVLENNTRTIPNMATVMLWVAALGGTVLPQFDPSDVDS